MTGPSVDLTLPPLLSRGGRDVLLDVAGRNDAEHGADFLGLMNDRDGRALERRLDAAESVPWLLDTSFTLAGRVRLASKSLEVAPE